MTTSATELQLSVVLPAYNEARNIVGVVSRMATHLDGHGIAYEIHVVDDGSRDATAGVVSTLCAANPRVQVLRHATNRGYGAAIRSGLGASRGRYILVSDGDGQFCIEDFAALWRERERADLVLGYRRRRSDPWPRRLAGWIYNRMLVPALLGGRFRDVNCGFKLIASRALEGMDLDSTGALISAELLTRARLRGVQIVEVGVRHLPRVHGRATGLLPRVVLRMLTELVTLRRRILACGGEPARASLRADCNPIESASA